MKLLRESCALDRPRYMSKLLATVLSKLLAEHLFRDSIYTLRLRQKGIMLSRGRDLDLMQSLTVREAMTANPFVVSVSMSVEQLIGFLQRTHHHSFPVVDESSKLVGIVSLGDYERALERLEGRQEAANLTVKDIATMGRLLIAYEDEALSDAVQRLAVRGVSNLPVVARDRPRQVTGVIGRRDIARAYNVALTRQAEDDLDDDRPNLRGAAGWKFRELQIEERSRAAHQTVASLAPDLPYDCVVVSIRRHGGLLIPHGDTVLEPGDVLNVFVRQIDEPQLKRCLLGGEAGEQGP